MLAMPSMTHSCWTFRSTLLTLFQCQRINHDISARHLLCFLMSFLCSVYAALFAARYQSLWGAVAAFHIIRTGHAQLINSVYQPSIVVPVLNLNPTS